MLNVEEFSPTYRGTSPKRVQHVVVVDDDGLWLKVVGRSLGRQGYRVSAFQDPLHALVWLGKTKPDLVLTDLSMPELDGVELACRLLDLWGASAPPMLLLTGELDGIGEASLALFANAYQKPVSLQTLNDAVKQGLEDTKASGVRQRPGATLVKRGKALAG